MLDIAKIFRELWELLENLTNPEAEHEERKMTNEEAMWHTMMSVIRMDKEGGVMLTEGKPPVTPRFWFMGQDSDSDRLHYRVTLDNTEDNTEDELGISRYDFALDVTAIEIINDPEIPQKRMVEAAKILLADYQRQNGTPLKHDR